MKYAFIQQHRERFKANALRQTLAVSRSAYYDGPKRVESARRLEDRRF